MNQFPQAPEYSIKTDSNFFSRKIRGDIRKSRCTQVSTTPVANFSTSFTSVVDTGGKFATGVNNTGGKQWEQLSNC
jgi:hypothetical protein